MTLGLVGHRVLQGPDDVLLALDLIESTGTVSAVEGLLGHGADPSRRIGALPRIAAERHVWSADGDR